jgi:hypothetical protein
VHLPRRTILRAKSQSPKRLTGPVPNCFPELYSCGQTRFPERDRVLHNST